MDGVEFSSAARKAHAGLVIRAASIAQAHPALGSVAINDAAERITASAAHTVALERGSESNLRREGAARFHLTYADAASEAALAALLAACAKPGAPIAADPESLSVIALAERLAASDIPVLINGPTGTGKEVLSRFIHSASPRRDKPFIAVNCAAMPEAMLEAMLFGHQKGAFTGATQASEGFFRAADGGTLLLDEIAEMPVTLQAKLLRALQEGEVVPIGATQPIPVDVRIIACANRDLPTEVSEGRFRADLYYRLNVFPLALKALRERSDDIAPLAFALALRHTAPGHPTPWFSAEALAMLKAHGWPGNVRELENVVRRGLLLAGKAPEIGAEHIVFDQPARLVAQAPGGLEALQVEPVIESTAIQRGGKLSNIVQISEARAILETLEACNGSRVRTARELGISERTLRYRLASMREAGFEIDGRTAVGGAR